MDEGEVDGAGAQAAQERDGRRVVGLGHVDGPGSHALEFWRSREAERGGKMEVAGKGAWRKALTASAYKYQCSWMEIT